MKTLGILFFTIVIASAANAQEKQNRPAHRPLKVTTSVNTTQKPAPKVVVRAVEGTVRTATCGTYIEVSRNGSIERFFPVNLDSTMNKEGYSIVFDYVTESASYPENCEINKAVRLSNVRYDGNN